MLKAAGRVVKLNRFGKGIAVIGLAFCLTVVFPGLGATASEGTDFIRGLGGEFGTRLVYSLREGFVGIGGVRVTLHVGVGTEGNPRAVMSIDNLIARTNQELDGDFMDDIFAPGTRMGMNINAMRIEALGPLWKDGPDVRVRAGRFYVHYSDWVARSLGRTGIEVNGLPFGNHTLRFYYGLPSEWLALRIDSGVNEQFSRIVTLSRRAPAGTGHETDAHIYLRFGSSRGSHTAVDLAYDGSSHTAGARVQRVRRWGSGNRVTVSLWSVDRDFAPPRTRRNRSGETVAYTAGEIGFETEVDVAVGPLDIGVTLGLFRPSDSPGARSTQAVSLTHSGDHTSTVELAHDPYDSDEAPLVLRMTHENRKNGWSYAGVIAFDKVIQTWEIQVEKAAELWGQQVELLGMVGGSLAHAKGQLSLTWEAPNGLLMGMHYATHDSEAFGLEKTEWHPAGIFFTAEAHLEF